MRPYIIVTVKDSNKFNYDMEFPTNVPVSILIRDLVELINDYNKKKVLTKTKYNIRCERTAEILPEQSTLGELGIWSGDILVLQ